MAGFVVHAVGDVFVNRPNPAEAFSRVRGIIGAADVVFGNCEVPFVSAGTTTHDTSLAADIRCASGLEAAGFNVMSCANNHIMDKGPDVFLSTLEALRSHGIATAGAGAHLGAARQPALVATASGATVAVLAYASFFRVDDVATVDRPGVVAVGGETISHAPRGICSPGVAPVVTSTTNEADVAAMVDDIERARNRADVVLTSFHWGDATRPSVLTDHECRVARLAIDAGADVVLGHHHHVLRGIDIYRGEPIFYGLGNFVWDAPAGWAEAFSPETRERMNRLGKYALRPRAGYPRLPFHPDGRMTVISRLRFHEGELEWSGFLPCVIGPDGVVEPLDADNDEGRRVVGFVQEACADAQLPVALVVDRQEQVGPFSAVRVCPTSP